MPTVARICTSTHCGATGLSVVWYVGSAVTRFDGCDADALRRALLAGRTSARVDWSWTASKLPLHLSKQLRAAYRFLRRDRHRFNLGALP